jgi:hypothetical protein
VWEVSHYEKVGVMVITCPTHHFYDRVMNFLILGPRNADSPASTTQASGDGIMCSGVINMASRLLIYI